MKINESQLRKIIKESIKKVLKEGKVVNNKPWHSSQQYKDGYEATFRNRADWNEFLNDKGYNCEEIFLLDAMEKADVLSDYHEALFKRWVNEELAECDMYEG